MARDEARLGAKEYGLSSYENAYEFKVYDDQKASWVEAKKPLQKRTLPSSLSTKIELERVERGYTTNSSDLPPVLILSSGEVTPFQFRLVSASSDQEFTLSVDEYGNIARDEKN